MPVATIQRRSSEYFEHIDSDISARLARAARPGGTVNQAGDRQFVETVSSWEKSGVVCGEDDLSLRGHQRAGLLSFCHAKRLPFWPEEGEQMYETFRAVSEVIFCMIILFNRTLTSRTTPFNLGDRVQYPPSEAPSTPPTLSTTTAGR